MLDQYRLTFYGTILKIALYLDGLLSVMETDLRGLRYLKSKVYFERPQTTDHLKWNIRTAANNIPLVVLTK